MVPDGAIRGAIVSALQAQGVSAFDTSVPVSTATPVEYVLIQAQGRTRTAVSKQNYEWMGSVVIGLNRVNEKGFVSNTAIDSLDSKVEQVMRALTVPGYRVAMSRLRNSTSDTVETPATTVSRRHKQYEIWVNRKT